MRGVEGSLFGFYVFCYPFELLMMLFESLGEKEQRGVVLVAPFGDIVVDEYVEMVAGGGVDDIELRGELVRVGTLRERPDDTDAVFPPRVAVNRYYNAFSIVASRSLSCDARCRSGIGWL